MLTVAVALAAGVIGVVLGAWLVRRSERASVGHPPRRRSTDWIPRDTTQEALIAAFRPEELPAPEEVLLNDQRILSDALREIRHRRGAMAAALWVLDQTMGGEAIPAAWSSAMQETGEAHGAFQVDDATRALIEWAGQARQLGFDGGEGPPRLAVAPFEAGGERGVLSLHFDDGALVTRDAVREWMPHHARMMQTWYELVRTRSDVARQNFRLRGLIRTAGTLQAARDPLELERTLVVDSLTVVGAEWAVLVRWDERGETGAVRAATVGAIELGVVVSDFHVARASVAGSVCADGQPVVLADARHTVAGSDQVFGSGRTLGSVGSLLAVPLVRGRQERPIGALVCGHSQVQALRATEARNAKNLAVIAAGALETAWAVDDARRNARTDPLTGLANRRGFEERFAQVVNETDRYGGTSALIMVDIDFFKRVNDTHGHDAGDRVLTAVAAVLADGRRTVDLASRLGGEELALLLPQTDTGGAREVAERLRQRIEGLRVRVETGEVQVTASFGISEYAARVGRAEQVMDHADKALYAAKRNGRNRVEVFA
ncbi:MAG: GGDEF domain-containing protein [Gemmatimonadales bacterium]|nr:GGDEF domain-containing protein [Gemmatimonadales bacterium]